MAPRRFASFGSIAAVAVIAVAACTASPGPTPTPAGTPPTEPITSAVPTTTSSSEVPASEAPPPTEAPATEAPPTEPTATEPPSTEGPTAVASIGPGTSPSVDSVTVIRKASCTSDNGTGTVGQVSLSWSASNTTGVRISIDPPSAGVAYQYGFGDYPASGTADLPFSCGAPNHDANGNYHLYVVTTVHTSGYAFYRFAKVYELP